jgi:hypothetical protein
VRWKAFDEVAFTIKKGANPKAAPLLSFAARTPSLALLPLAIIPSALYTFHARSILLTDVLALAFAHNALALLKIDSFQTGSILLGGLFFYDVWWVFGTEVVSCSFAPGFPFRGKSREIIWARCDGRTCHPRSFLPFNRRDAMTDSHTARM